MSDAFDKDVSGERLFVAGIEKSENIVKYVLSNGQIFYTREQYFQIGLESGLQLSDEVLDALFQAMRTYLAECKAVSLLNYAENSRFMLTTKLVRKGFSPAEYEPALDYLEAEDFLSDRRFAESWVRSRLKRKAESRLVILGKLTTRGVSSELAEAVVADYFQEVDETALCVAAFEKQLRKCKDVEKVFRRLQRAGFSYSLIRAAEKSCKLKSRSNDC